MESITDKSWVLLEREPLEMQPLVEFLTVPEAGGVDIFLGITRRWTGEAETEELAYDAYEPMALAEMERLVSNAAEKWPILKAVIHHRIGVVPVKEASVILGVSTAHRSDAFEATRFLIDQLKVNVPI